jgi:hypothetical protein
MKFRSCRALTIGLGFFATIFAHPFVHSHDSTDWRRDQEAFRSYRVEPTDPSLASKFDPNIEVPVDPAFIKQKLGEFSGTLPTVIDGRSVQITERSSVNGRTLARKFLAREFTELGYTVSNHKYPSVCCPGWIVTKVRVI